jgi:hypothetical protein
MSTATLLHAIMLIDNVAWLMTLMLRDIYVALYCNSSYVSLMSHVLELRIVLKMSHITS